MADQFKRIIDLVSRTGDRCIITDTNSAPAYVVLSFKEYERLISGADLKTMTEDELLHKINRDIAVWRASQDQSNVDIWPTIESVPDPIKSQATQSHGVNNQEKELNQAIKGSLPVDSGDTYAFEPID